MKMSWVKASHPNQTVGCHSPAFSTLLTLVFNPGRKLLHKVMSKFWWVSVLKQLSSKTMSTGTAPRNRTTADNPAGSGAGETQEPPSPPSLAFILPAQREGEEYNQLFQWRQNTRLHQATLCRFTPTQNKSQVNFNADQSLTVVQQLLKCLQSTTEGENTEE